MTTGHYLRSMKQLANQWTPTNYRDERRQRLYLKDIDCPPEWHEAIKKLLHPSLFYLNDNVSAKRGGRKDFDDDDDDIFGQDAKPAIAGDLMSSLPEEMRAQNLMCYIGHEGTYTPAHREMCASLGQNIMVETSTDENGEKAGSSVWFMTESNDRAVVREYFLSMLGHDIEIEKHFAQINAWKRAPFDVYVVEQKAGDFILIPPLAAHQVWNRGTRTMKVAWNRTTVDTLGLAIHEALPKARLVCRDEQYKNKAIIFYTLEKYYRLLQNTEKQAESARMNLLGIDRDIINSDPRTKQLAADFKKLVGLFAEVLVDEMFAVKEKEPEYIEFDSCVTCSYCRANIFNRFLTCKHCVRPLLDGNEDTYDICMECYAMGRSCACLSGLQWCEQWQWADLVNQYETWRALVIKNDGYIDVEYSPQPFEVARLRSGRRSVAEICQEALKRRPWKDITKPEREKSPSDSEPEGPDGRPRKKKSRKTKRGEVRRCHVCCHRDYAYRVQMCTNPGCNEGYCYGVLYRAFDMMPQQVLANEHWQCPKCLGICNCGKCRKSDNADPYTPKNTSLGHDTRPIADDRSVEALVDFRIHNLTWLKAAGEESRSRDSKRMKRLREQADNDKATTASQQARAEAAEATTEAVHPPNHNGDGEAVTDGYGDQSHIVGSGGPDEGDLTSAETARVETELTAEADVSMAEPEPTADDSMYPDPTTLATHRVGMGYYEQDNTPDAILFDEYQAPSINMMTFDKSDVSDFVKKAIRAAKRKQRKANEDPEFVAPKSHIHKKARVSKAADLLEAMDPALFDPPETAGAELPVAVAAVTSTANGPDQAQENGEVVENPIVTDEPTTWGYPANEPVLRHAKPMASYLEPEDMDVDAIEEMMRHRSPPVQPMVSPPGSPGAEQGGKTAAELASAAVRALINKEEGTPVTPGHRGPGRPPGSGKPRGRRPNQPAVAVELPSTSTNTSPAAEKLPKRRGRPPKQRIIEIPDPEDDMSGDKEDDDLDRDITDLQNDLDHDVAAEEEPTMELSKRGRPRRSGVYVEQTEVGEEEAEEADVVEAQLPKKRGRPRKSAAVVEQMDLDAEEEVENAEAQTPPKRGRPRRSAAPDQVVVRPQDTEPNVGDTSFMSMRERMALRGKSLKVRGKRGRGDRPSTGLRQSARFLTAGPGDATQANADESESDKSPPPPRSRATIGTPPATTGGDDGSNGYVSSSSASSIEAVARRGPKPNQRGGLHSGSDEERNLRGKTARTTRGNAIRGRGRGRGRGRSRGR